MKTSLNPIAIFTTVLTATSLITYPVSAQTADEFVKAIPQIIDIFFKGNNNKPTKPIPEAKPIKPIPTTVTQQIQCPDISGAFQRPGDNLIIFWEQDGCNIQANAPSGGFDHFIKGKWKGQYFDYRVYRRNIKNGCETQMYGKLYVINNSKIATKIYGTDARCDLPANFVENARWTRI